MTVQRLRLTPTQDFRAGEDSGGSLGVTQRCLLQSRGSGLRAPKVDRRLTLRHQHSDPPAPAMLVTGPPKPGPINHQLPPHPQGPAARPSGGRRGSLALTRG